jgi:hypothetical protein
LLGRLESSADWGARFGAYYEATPEISLGFIYDTYDEDVTPSGPLFMGATPLTFDSEEIVIGAAAMVHPQILAALEWQQLTSESGPFSAGDSGFRLGVEGRVAPEWLVRLGTNDGAFSGGFGYQDGPWALNYAYISDWNDDSVGALLGGSDTHQLEVQFDLN